MKHISLYDTQLLTDVECDSPVEYGDEYPECNYLLNTHERCKPRSSDFVDVQHSLDANVLAAGTHLRDEEVDTHSSEYNNSVENFTQSFRIFSIQIYFRM